MIGQLDPGRRDITVVGAGFAGLLAAFHLDRAGYQVTLLEASDRVGGLLHTTHTPFGIAESAAHSFLANEDFRAICKDLQIELIEVHPSSRARFIWRGGKMRKFPLGIWELLRTVFRAYFILARSADTSNSRMTLEDWGLRHLGQPAVSYLLTPFLRGIYGARPRELSVSAAFPTLIIPPGHSLLSHFLARAWRGRKVKSPHRRMMAPRHGMGSVVAALEKRLTERLGPRFQKGRTVHELPQDAGNVILAVPAGAAATLLGKHSPRLASALASVVYAPLVSITVFVKRSDRLKSAQGVGVLMPEKAPFHCLGVLFNSSAFAERVQEPENLVSFTVMYGGTSRPELLEAADAELLGLLTEDFKTLFGLPPDAIASTEIHRWKNAVPLYDSRLEELWQLAESEWCAKPGHLLFGNFTGQVSLRGMADAAAQLAERFKLERDNISF